MPTRDSTDVPPYCQSKLEQLLILLLQIDVIELIQNVQEALIVYDVVLDTLRLAYFAEGLVYSSRYTLGQHHILLVEILLRLLN